MDNQRSEEKTKSANKKSHNGRGGKRSGSGPPKGRPIKQITRDRISQTIHTGLVVQKLHEFMLGERHEPSQVTAAKTLLDRVMPVMKATDITSKGEALVVERKVFRRPDVIEGEVVELAQITQVEPDPMPQIRRKRYVKR